MIGEEMCTKGLSLGYLQLKSCVWYQHPCKHLVLSRIHWYQTWRNMPADLEKMLPICFRRAIEYETLLLCSTIRLGNSALIPVCANPRLQGQRLLGSCFWENRDWENVHSASEHVLVFNSAKETRHPLKILAQHKAVQGKAQRHHPEHARNNTR